MRLPRRSLLTIPLILPWMPPLAVPASALDKDGVDLDALARLRPGMPVSDLQAAAGPLWRAPAPHKGGLVDGLKESHGVTARIDQDGRIGQLTYRRNLGELSIQGLRLKMTLKEAERAGFRFVSKDKGEELQGRFSASAMLSDTVRMSFDFSDGRLSGIEFSNPAAVYPPEGPPPYPAAQGEPGAPFRDPNLKLLVLSELIDLKKIDIGHQAELVAHLRRHGTPSPAPALEDPRLIPDVYDYLARYPIAPDQLAAVKRLHLIDLTPAAFSPAYRGQMRFGSFPIRTLEGIGHCPNIEEIRVLALMTSVDLDQLAALPKLSRVMSIIPVKNLDALLRMPALTDCSFQNKRLFDEVTTPGHPSRKLMETLKARGVKVRVEPLFKSDKPPFE